MKKKTDINWKQKISSDNYVVRENFAKYLCRKNIKGASKILIFLLKDREPIVRSEAIKSLKKIGDKKYLSKVLPLLNDKDEVVRADAVECVAFLGRRNATKYLANQLNDRSELVRRYAGGWLGTIGDNVFIKNIKKRLQAERSSLAKVGLIEGLYLLGEEERLAELIQLFKSRRYIVRCAVAHTLASLKNRNNKNLIKQSLLTALANETTIAAKSSIKNALIKLGK